MDIKNYRRRAIFPVALLFLLLGLAAAVYGWSRNGLHFSAARVDVAKEVEVQEYSKAGNSGAFSGNTEARGPQVPAVNPTDSTNLTKQSGNGNSPPKEKEQKDSLKTAKVTAVGVAVVGKNGELIYGPAEVLLDPAGRWGSTALGVLAATGLPYQLAPGWNAFVVEVAGQRNRGSSGWMYQVNGEVPMVGADKIEVRPGDKVIWWYSRSIDQPPPVWEDLLEQLKKQQSNVL